MVTQTSTVSRKNTIVINITRSRELIGFSCTVSKIQNTGHSRCISIWVVLRAWFHEKIRRP
ncbi:hypothetical protein B296_00056649 [Ensete ventricosum]|uniref:Uncharacterized protein n=1 Tax=Ensete ventricosum TaxID=4639 RepID=A0A426WX16_ENSVE|nr:hypothetical protein B296_00056649 [Ensete ventricosum]